MFKKYLCLIALTFFSFSNAQNVMSNGDMEHGDGGWFVWNKPEGPAKIDSKLAAPGIGVNGSKGAMVKIHEPPKIWWEIGRAHV